MRPVRELLLQGVRIQMEEFQQSLEQSWLEATYCRLMYDDTI